MAKKPIEPHRSPMGWSDGKPDWGLPIKWTNLDISETLADFPITDKSERMNPEQLVSIKLALMLFKCGADVESACKEIGLKKTFFHGWVNAHEDHKRYYQTIQDQRTVIVEDALFSKAISGDTKAMEFYLSRRGGERWSKKDGVVNINLSIEEQKNRINSMFGLTLDADTGEPI